MENSEEKLVREGQLLGPEEVKPETGGHAPLPENGLLDSKAKRKKRKMILFGGIGMLPLIGALLFYFFYLGHPSRQILARVNDEKITVQQFQHQFQQELAKVQEPIREMLQEEPQPFLEGMVVKMLLLQEAKRQGLTPPVRTYRDTDALPPDEALIAELMKKKFPSPPAVPREEVEAFYSLFKGQMKGGSFNQMAPAIEQILREGKQREEMDLFLRDLQSKARIEIDEGLLKKIAAPPPGSNTEEDLKKALASGKPVLVDFGANSCVPCRQLRPILKEVGKEYRGKASVLVIDVYQFQDLAKQYNVQLIPTLIFFDAKGKEVFRHLGVLDKEKIVSKLKEIGMES